MYSPTYELLRSYLDRLNEFQSTSLAPIFYPKVNNNKPNSKLEEQLNAVE